jgi:hypothetical protein
MKIVYKPRKGYQKTALASIIFASALCAEAQSSGPVAKPPYTVSVFAAPPTGLELTNPDSITTANGNIFVVYANATQADGTGGFSTIVEYSPTGKILRTFDVIGKSDGLKYNSFDHKLWALRNEDSNPALTLIDPKSGVETHYTYALLPPLHGGGYDDVVFTKGETFISASNPTVDAHGQNNFPSIVKARLVGHQVFVTPVLQGNASLIDIATGQKVVSLQSDPDSLKVDSAGDLVLDSQADGDLIFINAPGSPNQAALRLHLSNATSNITVDDTVFPTTPSGTIYVVDTKANTVYAVKSDAFQPGGAYSASDSNGILGKVDLSTGLVSPIVTGMKSPHGALFVSAFSDVSVFRSDDFSLQDQNVNVAFEVQRTGDISTEIHVKYVIKDLASEKDDNRTFTGSVQIEAGRSSAEFRVPITNIREIIEDGVTKEATVILEAGNGYNVTDPAMATIKLKDF